MTRLLWSFVFAAVMSFGGWKKRSLSQSGAIMAFLVGIITFYSSTTAGITLITFFVTSSVVTKLGKDKKKKIEGPEFVEGGNRDWIQVLSNSPATILCLVMLVVGDEREMLVLGYLAQLSSMQGDTWSSEIGVLSSGDPLLITTLQRVPKGTNGGVSLVGLAASFVGGLVLGLAVFCTGFFSNGLIIIVVAGFALLGSLVDSVLGSLLQYSGFDKEKQIVVSKGGERITGMDILDNHQVNLLTSVILMLIGILSYPLLQPFLN